MRPLLIALTAALLVLPRAAAAQPAPPAGVETIALDATDVARGILHARLSIPAQPGIDTVVYPRWIPGEHSPAGGIDDLAALHFRAAGRELAWKRDLVDAYAFHVEVPPGTGRIEATLDVLLAAGPPLSSLERVSTTRVAMLNWTAWTLYPQGAVNSALVVEPSVTLPRGWGYATALDTTARRGDTVTFETTTLERTLDSPLLIGTQVRRYVLARDGTAVEALDVAADAPEDLAVPAPVLGGLCRLFGEAGALFGARHFRHYDALLVLSDAITYNGIEHHESSDDRAPAGGLRDPVAFDYLADLIPHEFVHSWNGKYRRPYDLQVSNYQDPERTDLLWVYEGLTQYYGNVLASRSGLRGRDGFADAVAQAAAGEAISAGRLWRPLADTADAAPFLYNAPAQFENRRRTTDFYDEGTLLWLDADTLIRERTGGRKSLDDFARAFYGPPASGPQVVTYTREDVVRALDAVLPYDWDGFFRARVDAIAPVPPLDGIARAGYRLVYTAQPTAYETSMETSTANGGTYGPLGQVDARFSVGLAVASPTGEIVDVVPGSPAANAGLAPFGRILAIGGRRYSAAAFHAVVAATAGAAEAVAIPVVVDEFGAVSTRTIRYRGGERYPRLERTTGTTDVLAAITAPREEGASCRRSW